MAHRVGRVCVVGSSNVDLIAYTDRLPLPGETVLGSHFSQGFGGKGANQAVQAARLGSHVVMVTKLGEDSYGAQTRDNYAANSIDLTHVLSTPLVSSGLAPITVDKHGTNCIIVIPGANDLLSEQDVRDAVRSIESCAVLMCQNEVPLATTKEALRLGKERGLTTIFNVAPAPPSLPDDVLQLVDILCLNETEVALLAAMPCDNDEKLINAVRALIRRGAGKVVVTLGGDGCCLVPSASEDGDAAQPVKIAAEKVEKVVDTVGAGDSFLGTLGHFLAAGKDLVAALQLANKVAARSVQREGTQKSYPYRADLPDEWFQ